MKDPELEAYCDAIEATFFRLKARPGMLGPADFERVRRWFVQGVPLEAVLEGISDAFETRQKGADGGIEEVNSLGFCERFVREAAKRRRHF